MSISDVNESPAKKICTRMSQVQRETTQEESSFSLSNETDMSMFDTSMKQEQRETTQDSSLSPSTETEMVLSDVTTSPAKKKICTSISQEQDSSFSPSNETDMPIFDVTESPVKKIGTSMKKQEQRETTQESEFVLFGVSMTPEKKSQMQESQEIPQEYVFLASKEMQMPLTGILTSPAKSMSQETRVSPKEYLFFPSKEMEIEMSLSSASPMNIDDDSKKTNSLEDPEEGIVSTNLCLYDKTWIPENPNCPNVTYTPRSEDLTKEQARKIKEMRFLSNEQREEEKLYRVSTELTLLNTDPWIIKKELTKTYIRECVLLPKTIVDTHILKYLSEDDQKKLRQSGELTINVYDTDTHTTHKILLVGVKTHKYYALKNSWCKDFVSRRCLTVGDSVGFFWDHYHSTLNFRVLSRASTDEMKL